MTTCELPICQERNTHQVDDPVGIRRGPAPAGLAAVLLVGEDPLEVGDVGGGEAEGVQLGQLGVGRHPRQGELEAAERAAEDPHPGALAGVGGAAGNLKCKSNNK